MVMRNIEKIFPGDSLSKRERVELTLNHKSIDRVPAQSIKVSDKL